MTHVTCVKVLSDKTLGYSADFQKTHSEKVVETVDGKIVTAYSTDITLEDRTIRQGHLTDHRPYVEVPV